MRTLLILILTVLGAPLYAQPGDVILRVGPCGLLPYQEVDLTDDGIPDLLITGRSEGTDDEPSSSGTCSLLVRCATGTLLLSANSSAGPDLPAQWTGQGMLDTGYVEYDQILPTQHWYTGELLVKQWGYGSAMGNEQYAQPELQQTVFIVRTQYENKDVLTAFRIEPDTDTQVITVVPLAQVPYGSRLSW